MKHWGYMVWLLSSNSVWCGKATLNCSAITLVKVLWRAMVVDVFLEGI